MASIEKRQTTQGTRYRARITRITRITLKGHPRISETFATRREAPRWAERTTEAMRQRRFQPESKSEQRTMGDLARRYVQDELPHLAEQDQIAASSTGGDQLGRDTKLGQITPAAITQARDRLARGQGLSPARHCPRARSDATSRSWAVLWARQPRNGSGWTTTPA